MKIKSSHFLFLLLNEVDMKVNADSKLMELISPMWHEWIQEEDLLRLANHPLLQALQGENASIELLKFLLVQHSHYSKHFVRYLCSLICNLRNMHEVQELLENLQEEMGLDGNDKLTHAEMFQRTLRLVGADPLAYSPLPETLNLKNAMMSYCKSKDPLAGLAALCLGAEAIVPIIYTPILSALKKFGFEDEATEFFDLHIAEDENHALTMLEIMQDLIKDDSSKRIFAIDIGQKMLSKRIDMLDRIWNTFQISPLQNNSNLNNEKHFASADFWRVPSYLTAKIPDRLSHQDVMQSVSGGDKSFSIERKHRVHIVDLPTNTISMTIGHLDINESTRLHRHNYETVIYVIKGCGFSRIGSRKIEWKAGDAFYVPVWASHQHINTGDDECEYVACENAPLLQNLGGVALREELGH